MVAVALVGLVVYLVANPVDTTSPFNQTLSQTVSDFGVGARVVKLDATTTELHDTRLRLGDVRRRVIDKL